MSRSVAARPHGVCCARLCTPNPSTFAKRHRRRSQNEQRIGTLIPLTTKIPLHAWHGMHIMTEFFVELFASFPDLIVPVSDSNQGHVLVYTDASDSPDHSGMSIVIIDTKTNRKFIPECVNPRIPKPPSTKRGCNHKPPRTASN